MTLATSTDIVGAITELTATIRAATADGDQTRALPDSVIGAFRDLDAFRLLAPLDVGGAELDPLTFVRVIEAASRADGSVGWCLMIANCFAAFGGMLPEAAAHALFGSHRAIVAGAFRPFGRAVEVDGGYRVTGRWPLASGSIHATWYVGGCVVVRDGAPVIGPAGAPLVREAAFPAPDVTVIDNWDSTGLRATASHDIAVEDAFVPHERTMWFGEPPRVPRPLYHMPPIAMFSTFIAAVALGIARHAIDEFVDLADGKTPVLSSSTLADKPVAQDRLGRAQAGVESAHSYLIHRLGSLWCRVNKGHVPTLEDRGQLWLASTHAGHCAAEAVDALFVSAGASAVYRDCALDRCLRDVRTATQHVCTQEQNFELAGRMALGRPVVPSPWAMDLRDPA